MQLLGAKTDTVEPNRAEPWSAFSEGQAHPLLRLPSGSGVSLHLGGGVGVRSTHDAPSRCPSPTCQHPRITTTETCGLWTTRTYISEAAAGIDLSMT
jgi:hypothetical protein